MNRPSYNEEKQMIANQAAMLPREFGLRAWPGERFRVNQEASYYHEGREAILLYLYRKCGDNWLAFDKDSLSSIRREIILD